MPSIVADRPCARTERSNDEFNIIGIDDNNNIDNNANEERIENL